MVIQWENSLHFPCAAVLGNVVEVGTACRHGKCFMFDNTRLLIGGGDPP